VEVLGGSLNGNVYTTTPFTPLEVVQPGGWTLGVYVPDSVSATDLLGTWLALSPLHSYVVGAPLGGQTSRRLLERIQAESVFPGAVRPSLDYVERAGGVSAIMQGVCKPAALLAGESPADDPSPSGQWRRALTLWFDWRHPEVTLTDCPKEGVEWDDVRPYLHFTWLNAPTNVTGHSLLPVFYERLSGWNLHLFFVSIQGIMASTQKV
jgi:hypothetical protein